MIHYPYLIIGGGMSASAAAQGIRELDDKGRIGIISMESSTPYDRPPLSKKLWTGKKQLEDICHELPVGVEFYEHRRVEQIDLERKQVVDVYDGRFTYGKLLLATGGTPRRLPFGGNNIIYFRTLDTYKRLRHLADQKQRFVVIGGGFIGSELAAALAMQGKQVTLIFPEDTLNARLFPPDLAAFVTDYYREKGVEVLAGESVINVGGEKTELTVITGSGRVLPAHGVVAGIGVLPNVELATAAGLAVDNGIVVNSQLQTSHADVFAAGDVANYPDALLGVRRRVEHEDAAVSMGKLAGRNMAGAGEAYDYTPMYYSDLFDLGYEAVGELDARLDTVADWQEPYRKGVVYYLKDGRVRGVLLWDVWGKVDEARQLIAAGATLSPAELQGLL